MALNAAPGESSTTPTIALGPDPSIYPESLVGPQPNDPASTPGAQPSPASGESTPAGTPTPVAESHSDARKPTLLDRLLGRTPAEGEPRDGEPAKGTDGAATPAAAPGAEPPEATDWQPPKTRAEFEEQLRRAAQAETDRREAKRAQDAQEQRQREVEQKTGDLRRQLREARSAGDSFQIASLAQQIDDIEQGRESEAATRAAHDALHRAELVRDAFDRGVLDPVLLALPEAKRAQLLADPITDLEGRARATTGALALLEQHWEEQGARKALTRLRDDHTPEGQALRKELLAELRDEGEDPIEVAGQPTPGVMTLSAYQQLSLEEAAKLTGPQIDAILAAAF